MRCKSPRLARFFGKCLAVAVVLIAASSQAFAGAVPMYDLGGGMSSMRVSSMNELRFRNVVRQKFDFSCGSAALATLLTYHYQKPTAEETALDWMYKNGNQKEIRQKGFSLLDMKSYLASRGYRSDGYRLSLDSLVRAKIPAIALINTNGYLHFVVIKGVHQDEVLLGDSALGMRKMVRQDFEKVWNGILFVIRDDMEIAQSSFNQNQDWAVRSKAPFRAATAGNALGFFTLNISSTPGYYR